jgi:hypothetical protein
MATTLTSAPPVASRARAGDQVMYRRSLLPRWVVNAWPTEAQTIDEDDRRGGGHFGIVRQLAPDHREQIDRDESAAEEADHRQDADDEALAVAHDREPYGGDQQQDVQHVHRH